MAGEARKAGDNVFATALLHGLSGLAPKQVVLAEISKDCFEDDGE